MSEPKNAFERMILDERHRKSLERGGFRVVSEQEDRLARERIAMKYPPGHCWHMVPREDGLDAVCPCCKRDPCTCQTCPA